MTLEGILSTQRNALTDAEETAAQLRADLALAQAQARQYESAAGAQAQLAREAERTAARRARELEVVEAQRRGLETKALSLEVRTWSQHSSLSVPQLCPELVQGLLSHSHEFLLCTCLKHLALFPISGSNA